MSNFKSLAFIAATAALLSACSTPVKVAETPVVERAPEKVAAPVDTRQVQPVTTASVDPLDDPKGVLANRSIYFDFDKYVVREADTPVVQNHAAYLVKTPSRKILIQGNTDERGGAEYNLALGQKRAEAVRKSMAALGVPEGQMEAVSLGKEKPKAQGSNEAAWAENRRADIVY
ncbi:peptidoglycan-associated lipoprotein [Janthinobacterium sp. OK676]|uniref:Peptidoglycan-associated lipoprotein n=3 Tax=Janthinobacterium TaxID=29580 RepID=A0A031GFD4_9BURK|nr:MULTISPECIES: peptidoglycan-associated lipoprotein Pal [Janthinobacterium]AYM75432.1 peptidoglycan-associated lipoprotein Pal [Janthinobacterium agaricidamnosum]EZP35232.1 Lipoprotein Pal [Janthinobacterium lividum]KAB8045813.1 peptidoglycan-associated lipoprotein Pal [Janthinobacterium sp. FT68W]MBW3502262.1 peptidoglycan-associated lipoprotein Pal [Janthinobacterium sp. NKUCC08_JDC]MCC7646536.1 peptidoglycan-associated lipoprotein Pal [Janthinobacterium sp. EB271-G4-3-1]